MKKKKDLTKLLLFVDLGKEIKKEKHVKKCFCNINKFRIFQYFFSQKPSQHTKNHIISLPHITITSKNILIKNPSKNIFFFKLSVFFGFFIFPRKVSLSPLLPPESSFFLVCGCVWVVVRVRLYIFLLFSFFFFLHIMANIREEVHSEWEREYGHFGSRRALEVFFSFLLFYNPPNPTPLPCHPLLLPSLPPSLPPPLFIHPPFSPSK